jgi:hypothetical protein
MFARDRFLLKSCRARRQLRLVVFAFIASAVAVIELPIFAIAAH